MTSDAGSDKKDGGGENITTTQDEQEGGGGGENSSPMDVDGGEKGSEKDVEGTATGMNGSSKARDVAPDAEQQDGARRPGKRGRQHKSSLKNGENGTTATAEGDEEMMTSPDGGRR